MLCRNITEILREALLFRKISMCAFHFLDFKAFPLCCVLVQLHLDKSLRKELTKFVGILEVFVVHQNYYFLRMNSEFINLTYLYFCLHIRYNE